LARQAAAAVGVGTCWPWETAATLPSARPCEALRRLRGGEGRGHIVAAARLQVVTHMQTYHLSYVSSLNTRFLLRGADLL